jgi:hypothetical protein
MDFFILSTYGSCGYLYSFFFCSFFLTLWMITSITGIFFIPCSSCYEWLPLFQGFFFIPYSSCYGPCGCGLFYSVFLTAA